MSTAAKQSKSSNALHDEVLGAKSSTATSMQAVEQECSELREDFQAFVDEVGTSVSTYCRKRPGVAACALFVFGFYVGWKVKPW